MLPPLILMLLLVSWDVADAFNDDDNYHGYTGRCPPGWNEIDQMCYKAKNHDDDFRGALDECTSHRDNYHMYWEQGDRWLGPRYNLMPVEMLHSLMEHGQSSHPKIGRGPYRVNAIKTAHDHMWREYDGGETDIDVYRWKGGRKIDFSMFPEFNTEWGSAGDTLVWYPHTNKLYARPHYHKYDSLCYRRKQDAERCQGVPECSYHGDCYHGKCYCYKGWFGDDCCCKPKLYIVGGLCGTGDDCDFEAIDTTELFDFETGTSCRSVDIDTWQPYDGEMKWFEGELTYCGGYPIDGSDNTSQCRKWSPVDQEWILTSFEDTLRPIANLDSVIVPKQGWWFVSGIVISDDVRTEMLSIKDRTDMVEGPELDSNQRSGHCVVAITDTRVALIGGELTDNSTLHTNVDIYDWEEEDWLDTPLTLNQGFNEHECALVMDPECGHPVVVIIGGEDDSQAMISNVHIWDTITDELRELDHTVPSELGCSTEGWRNMDVVMYDEETLIVSGGTCDTLAEQNQIYKYTIKDGFTKIGDMLVDRAKHATAIVWGDDFRCATP